MLVCGLNGLRNVLQMKSYLFFVLLLVFRWGTHLYMSLFLSIHLSVCRVLYLRNRTSSHHNFWYTYLKWWYLQAFFTFFKNFDFLGCYGGKRAKNSPKWEITITSVTHHIHRFQPSSSSKWEVCNIPRISWRWHCGCQNFGL